MSKLETKASNQLNEVLILLVMFILFYFILTRCNLFKKQLKFVEEKCNESVADTNDIRKSINSPITLSTPEDENNTKTTKLKSKQLTKLHQLLILLQKLKAILKQQKRLQ